MSVGIWLTDGLADWLTDGLTAEYRLAGCAVWNVGLEGQTQGYSIWWLCSFVTTRSPYTDWYPCTCSERMSSVLYPVSNVDICLECRAKHRVSFISIYINGVTSKIENQSCLNVVKDYDVICLSEVKTIYPFSLPGYHCLRSGIIPGEEGRGVGALFKNPIWPNVYDIRAERDQIWFRLQSTPNFLFGALYTPRLTLPTSHMVMLRRYGRL